MKRYLTLSIFALLAFMAMGQQKITLDEVLATVSKSSYAGKNSMLSMELETTSNDFFLASFKPSLNLSMNLPDYINTSRGVTQPNGSIAFQTISQNNAAFSLYATQPITATGGTVFIRSDLQRFDDFSSKFKSYNGIPFRVGIEQPIFGYNAFKWDKKIQSLRFATAVKKYNFDIENAKRNMVGLYFYSLLASSNLDIAIANENINTNLLSIAEERDRLGKLSQDEKLQLQNALAGAKVNRMQSLQQFKSSLMDLDNFGSTNYHSSENLSLAIPEPYERLIIDEQTALAFLNENHHNLLQYQMTLLQADSDIARAKVENGMQVSLRASFGLARGSQSLGDVYTDPFDERQVSLGISVPLVNWGKKKLAVSAANIQKDIIQNQVDQGKAALINELQQAVNAFNSLQNEVLLQKDIMINAEKRFEISNQRYILGNIGLTELTIAQADKDRSKRDYVLAISRYWDAYYTVRALTAYDFYRNEKITN